MSRQAQLSPADLHEHPLGGVRISESQKISAIEEVGAPWLLRPPSPLPGSAAAANSPVRPKSARHCTWWQAGEREADREIAVGDLSPVYRSAEDMVADLDRRA